MTERTPGIVPTFRGTRRELGTLAEVEPLMALCATGKVYEIEAWIVEGRPIQFPKTQELKSRRWTSTPMGIAIKYHGHSLAALLLANGYDPNGDFQDNLALAVEARDAGLVKLLLNHGTDPNRMNFCDVLLACEREAMDAFVAHGVDPCQGDALARALHTKRRPILGFVKQYREQFPAMQSQIDHALHLHAADGDPAGVALMLWLGANPHAETPAVLGKDRRRHYYATNAFETALWSQKPEIAEIMLKQELAQEHRDKALRAMVSRGRLELVRKLLKEGANPNVIFQEEGTPVLAVAIHPLVWVYASGAAEEQAKQFEVLECVLKAEAKWEPGERQLKSFRRELTEARSEVMIRVLRMVDHYQGMSHAILTELTRTPAMRKVLKGFSKPQKHLRMDW